MKEYLIFFDIDGTLLDEKTSVVPESTKRALKKAQEAGHRTFICTGRCQTIWPQEILDLGFDGVVGGCGTHIIYRGEELLHDTLDTRLTREIADDIMKYHIDGVLEGAVHSYFRPDPWMSVVKKIYDENSFFADTAVETLDEETLYFDKMALWHDESSDMDSFKKKYEDRFDFIERDPSFYEIVPKGHTKATGIEFVCDYLGFPIERTMSFGDSTNDLPMLKKTAISIAMGSGNPDIFSVVDYVTSAVMDDGIEKALQKYGVID